MAGKEVVGAVASVIGALADGMLEPALLPRLASRLGTPRTRLLAITTSNAGPLIKKPQGIVVSTAQHRSCSTFAPLLAE